MRKLIFVIAVLFVLVSSVQPASAAAPIQDWMYANVHCSGMSPQEIADASAKFDLWYGKAFSVNGEAAWRGSYEARTNLFSNLIGCPDVLKDGQLTFNARLYAPTFKWLIGNAPQPE